MSISDVRKELLDRKDRLSNWCKTRKKMFVDTSDAKTYASLQMLATWVSEKPAVSEFVTSKQGINTLQG
jgi:phage host-nuclease inhibitor protein Gam